MDLGDRRGSDTEAMDPRLALMWDIQVEAPNLDLEREQGCEAAAHFKLFFKFKVEKVESKNKICYGVFSRPSFALNKIMK